MHPHGTELPLAAQSFVKDVEDLGLHDSVTDRCRVSAKTGLPDDIKMPAWLKAYNKVPQLFPAYQALEPMGCTGSRAQVVLCLICPAIQLFMIP